MTFQELMNKFFKKDCAHFKDCGKSIHGNCVGCYDFDDGDFYYNASYEIKEENHE